ncbi:MAG: DUF7286 family protein [Halobacteriota archaeon]
MRLADDTRARVPFAIVGILLLLGSTTFAATMSTRGPVEEDHTVDRATERVTASATAALRTAVADAARDAARNPVTDPAGTSVGRVLNESTPFRDALRVRIYLVARDRLSATRYRHGRVEAVASLPPTPNASALRTAKQRVRIRGTSNGSALEATVANVTVTVRRAGRVVHVERESVTLTVPTPVLALHDRTADFERRLNRGALDGPGLERQLTARLYAVTWARGYGQYAGAPIENVLANRHVELSTNGGVLSAQRAAFGQSDPAGRRGLRRATVRTGLDDVLTPIGASEWTDYVLADPNEPVDENAPISRLQPTGDRANRTIRVGVNNTADRAAVALELGHEGPRFREILRNAYATEVRLRTAVTQTRDESVPTPRQPGPGWKLVNRRLSSSTSVSSGAGPQPTTPSDGRTFETFTRQVTREHTVRWTWRFRGQNVQTSAQWEDRYRVGVALVGRVAPSTLAPERPIAPKFERGGALDGPNLESIPGRARTRLIEEQGGPEKIAEKVATGGLDERSATIVGQRPERLDSWVRADVRALRTSVRKRHVNVSAMAVATRTASPASKLAASLRTDRDRLIDAPDTYDGVADRARLAARAAYLNHVIAALDERVADETATTDGFDSVLEDGEVGSTVRVRNGTASRTASVGPRRRHLGADRPGGSVVVAPDGDPAYLTVAAVGHEHVATIPTNRRYHPLAAENTNLFTLPYGDAADEVVDGVFGHPERTRLRTAARALVAANQTLAANRSPTANQTVAENRTTIDSPPRAAPSDAAVRARRDRLQRAVDSSLNYVVSSASSVLKSRTTLSSRERRATIRAALGRWNGTGNRALAVTNGSFAAAVAHEANARLSDSESDRGAALRVALRVAVEDARAHRDGQVSELATNRTVAIVRETGRRAMKELLVAEAQNATEVAHEKWVDEALGSGPAGLPVAPVPGYWYATTNVWTVRVRGSYHQFTVRARQGPPTVPGATVQYVRDGTNVTIDVDGDGHRERLGRNERVSFEARTVVAVAVPAGGNGVGDVDGDANERSAGWPWPGYVGEPVDDERAPDAPTAREWSRTGPPTEADNRFAGGPVSD